MKDIRTEFEAEQRFLAAVLVPMAIQSVERFATERTPEAAKFMDLIARFGSAWDRMVTARYEQALRRAL